MTDRTLPSHDATPEALLPSPRLTTNPVWVREMRQAVRLTRTPVILATVTILAALLMCSVGGIASTSAAPATVGATLFHVFFSLALAVVAWVGPGVAAMTIASEKSGHTWEALLLTGLSIRTIARGKFTASLSYIVLYIVMLAPVGTLPFLFGGVNALEVVLAFALLLLFCALSVGFGLAVSSALSSPGLAVVVTLPIAVALSTVAYTGLGVGLSFVAHDQWPGVVEGGPVWLPTAYMRAPFDAKYAVYLLLLPIGTLALTAWFLYETTVANMMDATDERSLGLKRWLLTAAPAFGVMASAPAALQDDDHWIPIVLGQLFLFTFVLLVIFLFAGDVLEPSRRIRARWQRQGVGALRRFFGPGIVKTMGLVILVAVGVLGALSTLGIVLELAHGGHHARAHALACGLVGGYAIGFAVFLAGFVTWVRARSLSGTAPRLLLLLSLFAAVVGPWIAMAIAGVLSSTTHHVLLLAAPSPAFVIPMVEALTDPSPNARHTLIAGTVATALWTVTGLFLLTLGARRTRVATERSDKMRAELEARGASLHPEPDGEAA